MSELLVEVRPRVSPQDRGNLASSPSVAPEAFAARSEEIVDSIVSVSRRIQAELDKRYDSSSSTEWALDSLELNFELAVQAESGVIIAKASAGATFSVKLSLKKSGHLQHL